LLLPAVIAGAQAQAVGRRLRLDDRAGLQPASDPQCAPDGGAVAYVLDTIDVKADEHRTHVWLADPASGQNRQLTYSPAGESSPRWSPDGKYLGFLSDRPGPAQGTQIWLLPRAGGEARQLTAVKGEIEDYAWAPDSRRLALVIHEPAPEPAPGAPRPMVIDRYLFREDTVGFRDDRRSFIYIFDRNTRQLTRLTRGNFDESHPAWSPDGTRIAFSSDHSATPDRDETGEVFVADVRPGTVERQLTRPGDHAEKQAPAWSPDGRTLAFLEGAGGRVVEYAMDRLAVVPADGAAPARVISAGWDRGLSHPRFLPGGDAVEALTEDDMSAYPVRVALNGEAVTPEVTPPVVVTAMTRAGACWAGVEGSGEAAEVYAFGGGRPRQLSHHNDAFLARLDLGRVQRVAAVSADGTEIHGLLTTPPGYRAGRRVPLLLRIHGGPVAQEDPSFDFESQLFAAHGYAVLRVNYRGSSGRGERFQQMIAADWGHLEVQDLLAMVDKTVAMGVADPRRLGVGGWSYGAILTDYLIASTSRFRAATSGAGTGFTIAFYGHDQYINQYNQEIGPPWQPRAWALYQKLSYPFLHADRIHTPTLFLGGTSDANVPLEGGEQMYEALQTLGVPTELIAYPGAWHELDRPGYMRDRRQRYLAWYAKYLGRAR
jgi:dipeptidyl aminopeptidase/acylaminoacyl peptidase